MKAEQNSGGGVVKPGGPFWGQNLKIPTFIYSYEYVYTIAEAGKGVKKLYGYTRNVYVMPHPCSLMRISRPFF